ncbi:RNA recognition motif domain containing protein [Babesia ovis]|uniref:RNA recognition motif domain containing protein n=1 Tax=Babesia ovis TaxID=5869 RepID=A0A9W5WV27_BABOV|nr:RNA recognition motif domain containing protein [Babesia ovis]
MEKSSGYSVLLRNLRFTTTEDHVRDAFERFGKIRDVYIPLDYNTGKPRGFGFVEFLQEDDALDAIKAMDNATLDGNVITCCVAQDRRKSPNSMRKVYNSMTKHRGCGYQSYETRDPQRAGYYNRGRSRSRSPGARYARRSPSYERRYLPPRDGNAFYHRRENEQSPERFQRPYPNYPREPGSYRDYRDHTRPREYRDDIDHREYRDMRNHGPRDVGREGKGFPERSHHPPYPGRPYQRRVSPPRRHEPPHPKDAAIDPHDMRPRRPVH